MSLLRFFSINIPTHHFPDAQVNFNQPLKPLKSIDDNFQTCLIDFFDFFANKFDPKRDVLCTFYGSILARNDESNPTNHQKE